MHFRQRAPPGFELNFEKIDQHDRVKKIIDEKAGEFLCIMDDDEDVEWKKLGPTHPLISEFRRERENLMKIEDDGPLVIEEGDLKEFMSSMWEEK